MTIIKADDVLMRMLIAQAVVDDGDIKRDDNDDSHRASVADHTR